MDAEGKLMKLRFHVWPEKNRGWLTAQPVRRV